LEDEIQDNREQDLVEDVPNSEEVIKILTFLRPGAGQDGDRISPGDCHADDNDRPFSRCENGSRADRRRTTLARSSSLGEMTNARRTRIYRARSRI
jgi:hypothetical protein